jgi:outer membrane protein TolC
VELADSLSGVTAEASATNAEELVRLALEGRSERKAITYRLDGIQERQHAASKANKPTINFIGGADYARPNSKIFPRKPEWQETWDLGVNVNWNFLDFGRTKAQVAETAAAAKAARERLADFDSIVTADVRQRLLDLDSAQAQVKAASDAVASATEARRVVANRFTAGVATSTDVLVAQVAMLEVELQRTRALAAVRLAEARLDRTLGR